MKIEVKNNDEPKKGEYPWIGIDADGDICVFTKTNTGVLIFMNEEKGTPDGDMCINDCEYHEDGFKPFNGTITLSN